MCYNARYLLEKALKRARHYWQSKDMEYFEKALKRFDELYHVSGFSHPEIIIYTNDQPYIPVLSTWGLVPHWIKTEKDARDIWNKTLNAKGESIFNKPSFSESAKHKRCLIPVDGFYEHHHIKGKTFPYFIYHKDNEPLYLAGLWSEWKNPKTGDLWHTCSIITTKANTLMSKIHNNPKIPEPRMPVIIPSHLEDEWLKPFKENVDEKALQELLLPYPDEALKAHTVQKLTGKAAFGNVPDANKRFSYYEIDNDLFKAQNN